MRALGIDYGEKRVGLSYGDELGVATPLPALTQASEAERISSLAAVVRQRGITDLVFGYPYNMDGTVGSKAREVDRFIEKVMDACPLPAHRVDERLTSHEVKRHLGGRRDDALRRSGKLDSAAATVILQDYLDQHAPQSEPDWMEDER